VVVSPTIDGLTFGAATVFVDWRRANASRFNRIGGAPAVFLEPYMTSRGRVPFDSVADAQILIESCHCRFIQNCGVMAK
jgi:hypothetical protein